MKNLICFIILLSSIPSPISAELFTALTDMEELLETESMLISNLQNYINAQEIKLDYFRNKVIEYQREHNQAATDAIAYLSNPVNAYLLTKRLTVDWKEIENAMTFDLGNLFMQNISHYRDILKFPSDEDLNGAAVALMRLQDTYRLDTHKIAQGELNGVKYSTEMSANDCFELGRQSYMNHDYYHTVLWMEESLKKLELENNRTITRSDILEYLAFSTFKQGDTNSALHITNELLEIIPDHERAKGNKIYYEKELRIQEEKQKMRGDDGSDKVPVAKEEMMLPYNKDVSITYNANERKLYEMGCRGELIQSPQIMAKLKCRYVYELSHFLRIAPLKLEEASLKPYIVVYHEVLYDSEIEVIKTMAKPKFRRATVQNHLTGELEVAHYRISKSAWLKDEDHEVIRTIGRRLNDMTGLNMQTAEELQVVNYGIGGHYEPHFDFARKDEINSFKSLGTGNRIATVLFYMSDVAQGGATVFPHIRLSLWPKKGSAAFWFNLFADGQGDFYTRHAACPVLAGTKWVSNRWIHERGQEFLRPCHKYPDSPIDERLIV